MGGITMKQQYDSYKPSGIDWIGDIPSHWDIRRMRYLCDIITGDKDTVNRVDDGLYPFYVRSPQIERINSYSFDGEAVLMAGDGVGAGKVLHYATGKFDFHQRVYNFHNFREIKGKLLYQYLKSLFKYKIEEGGAKNTVDSVRQPWLKDFPVCIPPLAEQEAIAAWLDEKCGEIDAAIAKVEREIELIDELKQSEISRVVTRGLNPDAPIRPSGIDWIGDIPEHWKKSRIKNHISRSAAGVWGDDEKGNKNDIICFRIADFNYGERCLSFDKITIRNIDPKQLEGRYLSKGDLLIEKSGGGETTPVGRVVYCNFDGKATYTNFIHSITLSDNVDSRFFLYYFNMLYSNKINLLYFNQTTGLQNLQIGEYLGQAIYLPPLSEQQAIADYLDKKCAEIDGLKAKLNKKRETLKELRQSIISEVMTGKRKVI